jgi:hypothetical protein
MVDSGRERELLMALLPFLAALLSLSVHQVSKDGSDTTITWPTTT